MIEEMKLLTAKDLSLLRGVFVMWQMSKFLAIGQDFSSSPGFPIKVLGKGLPVSPACLSVIQTSIDDSGHKGNTGKLLNSRVLGVL